MNTEAKQHEAGNLSLWEQVCTTDPKFTKDFQVKGGFQGTAINFTYQMKKATELWGPLGIFWTVDIISDRILDGAPLGGAFCEKVHCLLIKLSYPHEGNRGEVYSYGQTMLVVARKSGIVTDEDAPKKSLTDAIGKALSMLGFAADIHSGAYDSNKYTAPQKEPVKPVEPDEFVGLIPRLDGMIRGSDRPVVQEYLYKIGWLKKDKVRDDGRGYISLTVEQMQMILDKPEAFLAKAKAKEEEESK